MTSFSRLQLAAALLEYDNDPDDPNPSRSAQDSAIFSHIRTRDAPRARILSGFDHLRETPNLLGVEIPRSETASARGSIEARRSLAGTRNSRGSIDVLRNPFGDDMPESERGMEENEENGEDLEVDLEAWGMAEFLGNKEKPASKNRRIGPRVRQLSKAQSEILPQSYSQIPIVDELGQLGQPRHHQRGPRSLSVGGFGSGNDFLESIRGGEIASEADFRRRSNAAPLDPAGRKTPDFAVDRPVSAMGLKQSLPNREPLRNQSLNSSAHAIPFPSTSPDPQEEEERLNSFALPLSTATSRFDPKAGGVHTRAISSASIGSYPFLDSARERTLSSGPLGENLFVLPPPTTTSRFDPKAPSDPRPMSMASVGGQSILDQRERVTSFASIGTQGLVDENNPFSLPPPSPTRISRFDPKAAAHARTISDASLGSRMPPDGDRMSIAGNKNLDQDRRQSRPYTRMDLLRPKVLIMPSPLQGSEGTVAPPQLPEGFQLTTIGPPLPPGAKSTGRTVSHLMPSVSGVNPPVGSDGFTPNPRISLSLSQLTFRNSLMVGGQRDVAYEDIEGGLRRAREDGEQIIQEEDIEEEIAEEKKQAQGKAPGKLYGRSLMDELEARKEKLKSKQRVFTGDQRPTMMLRGQIRRSSTLIDPATLADRPVSQAFVDRPSVLRRNSSGSKPLLDFSGEAPVNPGIADGRIPNSKSVFGVDQLWERELARLKEIEAAEKVEEEARRRREEVKAVKKGKNKRKGKNALPSPSSPALEAIPRTSKVSELPPTLPIIQKATPKRTLPPVVPESDSDTDSQASEYNAKVNAARRGSEAGGWGSSDDEGRRKPKQNLGDSDSEDDVPLVLKLQMPTIRPIRPPSPDSEDEKPLAKVLERKSTIPDFIFDTELRNPGTALGRGDSEEDDIPLAVRHPRVRPMVTRSVVHDDDDDEKPLGLKQVEQQHQAQLNIMAQQQMMMQAQLHNSMPFGTPSMLSGFSPFILPPPTFSPAAGPPVHDPAKYHSVDQWRHNIATD